MASKTLPIITYHILKMAETVNLNAAAICMYVYTYACHMSAHLAVKAVWKLVS